jgi:Flp pilus assembly protein TadD
MQATARQGIRPEAARPLLRSEARSGKGDKAGSLKALEEATAIDARLSAAHMMLAQSYEEAKEYDKAMDRYRKILAVNPNDPIALNNLAYALAVRKGQPAEAIGYAERANTLTGGNPTIADTLAWVEHLLGRDREAAQLLSRVVKALPGNAEVRLHAAVVYAAIGMLDPAAKELGEALRLDPTLAGNSDVKALQTRLGRKQPAGN